ncbi:hypothetical protein BTR23_15015 [Alkalihalophilus pseudofirmus]|nr:hypothetical protein BTR23_15015 [Alkalihalophilus pseudofirmus]
MIEFLLKEHVNIATYQKPKEGNSLNGDSFVVLEVDGYVVCAVSDGLGSGEHAHSSSVSVMNVIKQNHEKSVKEIIQRCNETLVAKRGVVLTVVKFDCKKKNVHYSSIGNIGFLFYSANGQMIRPIPNRGFLSGRKVDVKTEQFPYDSGSTFVIFSDGVKLSSLKRENLIDLCSEEKAKQFIQKHVQVTEDDITILIGQLH